MAIYYSLCMQFSRYNRLPALSVQSVAFLPSFLMKSGSDPVCVQASCLLLSGFWAQVDSNHRPHAYQACALTS